MSRRLRISTFLVGSAVLLAVGFTGGVYWASRSVPDFYEQALEVQPERVQQASDEMLASATALASNVRKEGRWQALFTSEQINGWLAVDLKENYPKLLPSDIAEPRVLIKPRQATLACRYGPESMAPTVISIDLDMYVTEANTIALQIRSVKAGAIPVPMNTVLDIVSATAEDLDLTLRWRTDEGDPVALIEIPPTREGDTVYQLEALELRDSQVFLSGRTESANETAQPAHARPQIVTLAYFLSKLKVQN